MSASLETRTTEQPETDSRERPAHIMQIKTHKKNSTSYITLIFCVTGILAVAVGNLLWTLFVSLAG
jgi:hypothetical protein